MNWIKQLFGGQAVSAEVSVDHVELTSTHLVLGLQLAWMNRTDKTVPIKDVQVRLFLHGKKKEPLGLYPLERFTRVAEHKALQKAPVRPFTLPPNDIYVEHIRFISEEVLDIPVGSYAVEVRVTDTSDTIHTTHTSIHVKPQLKYRLSEEWQLD